MSEKQSTQNTEPSKPHYLTPEEIRDGCIRLVGDDYTENRICVIQEELRQGIDAMMQFSKSVTCYGSARLGPGSPFYELARQIAYRIASELKYAVISGGGPGIMEAVNRGAHEAGGESIGITIKLPHEQSSNIYTKTEIPFYYFFTRKAVLSFASEAYIVFPGGFGTLDEIMEVLTLIQTKKIPPVPVIFFGTQFWNPFDHFIRTSLEAEFHTISPSDLNLYTITDDIDTVVDIVKNAPLRDIVNGNLNL